MFQSRLKYASQASGGLGVSGCLFVRLENRDGKEQLQQYNFSVVLATGSGIHVLAKEW